MTKKIMFLVLSYAILSKALNALESSDDFIRKQNRLNNQLPFR